MADLQMAPLKIVGFEGVFGSVMMFGLLLPVAYYLPGPEGYGLHENSLDTIAMIKSSAGLQVRGGGHAYACPACALHAHPMLCLARSLWPGLHVDDCGESRAALQPHEAAVPPPCACAVSAGAWHRRCWASTCLHCWPTT